MSLLGLGALAAGAAPPAAAQWRVDAGAHLIPLYTRADPVPGGASLDEVRIVHPVLLASAANAPGTLHLMAMVNLEGATMPGGELSPGVFGEGYVDRRHPHTYLHELTLTARIPPSSTGPVAASLTAGQGFVPFGTDDPMSRPVLRYPVNHHYAQILERFVTIGAVRAGPALLEAALFNGDEPTAPDDWPALDRFGDSWAARLTLYPVRGVEAQVSHADVESPEHVEGAGLDQRKWSASLRWTGAVAGGPAVVLAEWARTSDGGVFAYRSALAEGAWARGRHRLHYRIERTERPEEERLADPFRTPRPHHDDNTLGTTRWTVHTAGYTVELPPVAPLRLAGMIEVSRAGVELIDGVVFDPARFYGDTVLWSLSAGLRLELGAPLHRMGRYGVAAGAPAAPHEGH